MLPIDYQGIIKAVESLFMDDMPEVLDDANFNTIFKLIPYAEYLNKIRKGLVFINDQLLYRKLFKFIKQLNSGSVDIEKVQYFRTKLETDEKYARKIVNFIFIYLHRFEESNKAIILAELMKSYIESRIDWGLLIELTACLDRLFINDILVLKKLYPIEDGVTTIIKDIHLEGLDDFRVYSAVNRLISVGLVNLNQTGFTWSTQVNFELSQVSISILGKKLIENAVIEEKIYDSFA